MHKNVNFLRPFVQPLHQLLTLLSKFLKFYTSELLFITYYFSRQARWRLSSFRRIAFSLWRLSRAVVTFLRTVKHVSSLLLVLNSVFASSLQLRADLYFIPSMLF